MEAVQDVEGASQAVDLQDVDPATFLQLTLVEVEVATLIVDPMGVEDPLDPAAPRQLL